MSLAPESWNVSLNLAEHPIIRPVPLGFRMPAEWHPHEATWLTWPTNRVTWPDRVDAAQETYLSIIRRLAPRETVHLLVDDLDTQENVRSRLPEPELAERITYHVFPTVDSWIRDYGPNFLIRRGDRGGELALNHWEFNAWGDKYEDLKFDARVPKYVARFLDVRRFRPGMVLEGGSIEVNNAGICMTTEQCLLNHNRNPHLDRAGVEEYLRGFLGVSRVLWLGEGIEGDDTDGHIDDIARFTDDETIVCVVEEDPASPNHKVLMDNLRRLELARDLRGRPFRIVPLPMPDPVIGDGVPLPASYANFYIANGIVLVPVFGQDKDEAALEIFRALFPGRELVGINCEALVWGMGAIHCLSQQQPAP